MSPARPIPRSVPAGPSRFVQGWSHDDGTIELIDSDGDLWTIVRTPKRWKITDHAGHQRITHTVSKAIQAAEAAGAQFPPWH